MQLPGTRWDLFNTFVFTGRISVEAGLEGQVDALAQRQAEHLRPRTSQEGARELQGIKGPE